MTRSVNPFGVILVAKNETLLMTRAFPYNSELSHGIAVAEAKRFAALLWDTDWSKWEQSWSEAEANGYSLAEFKMEKLEC